MARGLAGYAKASGLGAVSKRNRLFWPCSASAPGGTWIVADRADSRVLRCEAAS
jgi:hypothetical protein